MCGFSISFGCMNVIDFGHFPTLMFFFFNELTDIFYSSNLPHTYVIQLRLIFFAPSRFHHTPSLSGFMFLFLTAYLVKTLLSCPPFLFLTPIAHMIPACSLFSFHLIHLHVSPSRLQLPVGEAESPAITSCTLICLV